MHKMWNALLIVSVLSCVLVACGPRPAYNESHSIADGAWSADAPALFAFDIEDTLQRYDMWVDLRNGSQYPYSNIYLFIKTNFPNGRTKVDTLECQLADERGQWNGSGIGSLKSNTFGYRSDVRFPLTGNYSISIHHAMRMEEVPDIYDVGLTLEEVTP